MELPRGRRQRVEGILERCRVSDPTRAWIVAPSVLIYSVRKPGGKG
jgi:hypothetical protein